jgi:hypothetical protein
MFDVKGLFGHCWHTMHCDYVDQDTAWVNNLNFFNVYFTAEGIFLQGAKYVHT